MAKPLTTCLLSALQQRGGLHRGRPFHFPTLNSARMPDFPSGAAGLAIIAKEAPRSGSTAPGGLRTSNGVLLPKSLPAEPETPQLQSGRPDSNRRPPAPKAGALPDCATPRDRLSTRSSGVRSTWQGASAGARWTDRRDRCVAEFATICVSRGSPLKLRLARP